MARKLQVNRITSDKENSKFVQYLKSFDYWQILSLFILLGTGLLFIYSTGVQSGNEGFFLRQLFWVGVSIPVYIIFSHVDSRLWEVIAEPYDDSIELIYTIIMSG